MALGNSQLTNLCSYGYLYATLCFFGGVLLTYLFELALHAFERWLLARRSPTAAHDLEDVDAQSSSIAESPRSSTNIVANENLSIDHDVGHDGEMVAEIYRMTEDDTRALTRMGIFAGLALAFHVRESHIVVVGMITMLTWTDKNYYYCVELPGGFGDICSGDG